jgi:transposase
MQIERAAELVKSGVGKVNTKRSNDYKRFIVQTHCTTDGEIAQVASLSLNQEMIEQEARFDGFYAICTDLEDHCMDIIKINSGRWIIENAFRIMKTEFEARPVFLQRDDRIVAHFLTCFLSLLLFKYLEKKINRGRNHFSPEDIITALTDMNFLSVQGEGYIPAYTRTNLTNSLHGTTGFRTDTQIVTKKEMRKIISYTKNKRQKKDDLTLLHIANK